MNAVYFFIQSKQRAMQKISITILLFLSFPTFLNAADGVLDKGTIFQEAHKAYDKYELITGEIIFQKRDDENYTKGYRPISVKEIAGEVKKQVIDFPKGYSPSQLTNAFRAELVEQGFDLLFECEDLACGPIPGWMLYLSEYIGGSPANQTYVAAIRKFENNKPRLHLVYHVSEIDGQPRMVLHKISGSEAQQRFQSLPPQVLQNQSDLGLLHEIFFDKGIHQNFEDQNFQQFAKSLRDLSEQEEIILVGFADPEGTQMQNYRLAKNRAETIRNVLVNEHGIDGNRITVISGGELTLPKNSQADKLSRKVSIYKFSKGGKDA